MTKLEQALDLLKVVKITSIPGGFKAYFYDFEGNLLLHSAEDKTIAEALANLETLLP